MALILSHEENQHAISKLGWMVYDGKIRTIRQRLVDAEVIKRQAVLDPVARKIWDVLCEEMVVARLTGGDNVIVPL